MAGGLVGGWARGALVKPGPGVDFESLSGYPGPRHPAVTINTIIKNSKILIFFVSQALGKGGRYRIVYLSSATLLPPI